ncbi:hypothetical protein [Wolbachia endosymbiont (group B) of Episyrphus balteatus]|uniref:hypothetical protein n=1 Tax=Wolbachia endosymbiont (group B) of Episyrphus balteatus TaxID=2954009 RepID=UPI00222735BF|nr:hypothetical protein [Wolbachia endosymbiont (group B) of Episyrphus balteatus]
MKNWDQFLGAIGLGQLPGIIKALNIGDKRFEIRNGKINIDGKDFVILADKIQFDNKEYKIQGGKVTINGQEFELNIEKSISLSFDEEHRVAEQELYKHRMGLLSALVPTLFLSATPSISTHRHIKENDGLLKTLSLTDKMESDVYGALNLQVHTKVKSKDLAKEYSNDIEEYVDFKPEKNDQYNNANLTDDKLKKEVENYLYRNVQSVIGEPALILAESNKQIDNLKEILQYGRNETLPKSTGSKFFDFLEQIFNSKPDYKLVTKSKKFALITEQVAKQFNITKEKAAKIVKECYDFSGIADYSVFRVMHGIIENTLSCLTGLNRHELDEKRCADLKGLAGEVKAALDNTHDLEIYVKDQGVQSDKLKKELVQQMQSVIDVLKENKGSDFFIRLIRNWNQDKKLHLLMSSKGLEQIPEKLVALLSSGNYSVVRDYLEYYGVEESKIDDLCELGKEASAERRKFMNSLRGLSDEEQDKLKVSTPLGGNEKKLLEDLGKALKMILKNGSKLTYSDYSSSSYSCDEKAYPLGALQDFCYENKHKVKLENLNRSGNLSVEDLKSKLSDYISGQPLEELELVKKKLSLSDNQSVCEDLINLDTYHAKELKKAINEKNNLSINHHKKRILQDLNQEQLAKLAIDHLSEDELKDLYEDLLKEEKDYHALCRMGLVGNDVNPTKVQGYNDINLQHVGMLVDPISTDLNKPAQLIQAPGRLRCLNSNRHSTFFCYSNDELSFDINLLKKGDYIEAYNKSVVRLSNQQAYGNKLATEIIDYINQEIKSLKRIDDLADHSIQITLNSFIEVYNTNEHDFNKSKKEFIGVLKHARRKLNNYEKELRDNEEDATPNFAEHELLCFPYKRSDTLGVRILKILYKALITAQYLLIRFGYYLDTRSTYNSFLKKVNGLKSDSPLVNAYAHIIAEYSVKNVAEINLLNQKFNEVYQQIEEPEDKTDTKSFNNYLEHMSACLKHPVSIKLFDKITSPLMKGDYLLKLLDQIYPGEKNQDKVENLRKFRKNLKDKSFQFTKDDLNDIKNVQSCLASIIERISMYHDHYYRVKEYKDNIIPSNLLDYRVNSSFNVEESEKLQNKRNLYLNWQKVRAKSVCKNDLNELKILSQRENIKLAREAAGYVISPLLGDSSRAAKNKQSSEEDKKIINSVVDKVNEVKNDLEKNVKPFTTEDVISPSTKFINPIAKLREKVLRRVG